MSGREETLGGPQREVVAKRALGCALGGSNASAITRSMHGRRPCHLPSSGSYDLALGNRSDSGAGHGGETDDGGEDDPGELLFFKQTPREVVGAAAW
jgi:hypothetical protein